MDIRNFAAGMVSFGLLVAAPAFAQTPSTTPATKQPTQAWGGQSCNLVADAKADPECAAYLKNKAGNSAGAPFQAAPDATATKK
jgi:hypothetical protein